jgi:hypothetical protein
MSAEPVRVAAPPESRVMSRQSAVLGFADEKATPTGRAGARLEQLFATSIPSDVIFIPVASKTPIPYSICAVTRMQTAQLSMEEWAAFVERHPRIECPFAFEVMKLMSEVMNLRPLSAHPSAG